MNILLACILAVNVATLAFLLVIALKIQRVMAEKYEEFMVFVRPGEDGKGSPFSQVAAGIAELMAQSLMASLKATLMGAQSGKVRADKAIDAETKLAVIENTDLGQMALKIPGLRSFAKKNPGIIDFALSKFGGGGLQTDQPATSGSNGSHQDVFKI